jgi:hypothetical protein
LELGEDHDLFLDGSDFSTGYRDHQESLTHCLDLNPGDWRRQFNDPACRR